jgi:hypothetical protein
MPGRTGTGRVVARPLQWSVLHRDRLLSYVSWEPYEHNLHQLKMNNAQGMVDICQHHHCCRVC